MPAAWALQVALPVPLVVAHRAALFSSLCDVATHSILSQPFLTWVPGPVSALGTRRISIELLGGSLGAHINTPSLGFACAFTWISIVYSSLCLKYMLLPIFFFFSA